MTTRGIPNSNRRYRSMIEYFEPGGVYEGNTSQQREIIKIEDESITYRVVVEALGQRIKAPVGTIATVKAETFREWAQEEVA
jgi:hypothetical protein